MKVELAHTDDSHDKDNQRIRIKSSILSKFISTQKKNNFIFSIAFNVIMCISAQILLAFYSLKHPNSEEIEQILPMLEGVHRYGYFEKIIKVLHQKIKKYVYSMKYESNYTKLYTD